MYSISVMPIAINFNSLITSNYKAYLSKIIKTLLLI
jgi:hypothetical protein